jgi:hypothetical protein
MRAKAAFFGDYLHFNPRAYGKSANLNAYAVNLKSPIRYLTIFRHC